MGRPEETFYWDQVTVVEKGKSWMCNRCARIFGGGCSRIKAHLDQIKGKGIAVCSVDPNTEAAHNIITSNSSYPQTITTSHPSQVVEEPRETMAGSINDLNNTQSIHLLEDLASNQAANRGISVSESSELNQLVSDLTREEDDMMEQIRGLESRGKKRSRPVDPWLDELRGLKKDTNNSVSLKKMEMQSLKKEKPLVLSDEFVGDGFEENVREMWKLLADDEVFVIGIHGMGGVGKTLLATYMESEIRRSAIFKDVFRITVSQECSISKLQHHIAKKIDVKLDDEDDEITRAANLSLGFETREKLVLILDDVWSYIDPQKLGIPIGMIGIKLIVISRLQHVCRQMGCLSNNMLKVNPLYPKEALELFFLKLRHHGTVLEPPALKIVESIASRCDGLPLEIIQRARIGRNHIRWWKHELNKIENLEMDEDVLNVLKLSYDNLVEKEMQNCFLYCALLCGIDRREVIMKLVEIGVLNGKRSLEEIFKKGHIILDNLMNHSMLNDEYYDEDDENDEDDYDDKEPIGMNGLLKRMACHILKDKGSYMIKYAENLEMYDIQEWSGDLEIVSLISNSITDITPHTSPYCPRLSTLLLRDNYFTCIPDCFFIHMNALAILELSRNMELTGLPNSVGNLKSLVSLVLEGCEELKYVPPLRELQALSRLVISNTSIEGVPEGLENLINLKWLDLSRNKRLHSVSGSVLSGLNIMQYLDLRPSFLDLDTSTTMRMCMLEYFGLHFQHLHCYNTFVEQISNTVVCTKNYSLSLLECLQSHIDVNGSIHPEKLIPNKVVAFKGYQQFPCSLPKDLIRLVIHQNDQLRYLGEVLLPHSSAISSPIKHLDIVYCNKINTLLTLGLLPHLQRLETIRIADCDLLEQIFAVHNDDGDYAFIAIIPLRELNISHCCEIKTVLKSEVMPHLQRLETITIEDCESLEEIFALNNTYDVFSMARPKWNGTFTRLRNLHVTSCNQLKTLLTSELVPCLQNLEEIKVWSCDSLEEIFVVNNSDDDSSFELPSLTSLSLSILPKLMTVCKGTIRCRSTPMLHIQRCPNLERSPTIQIL